MPTAARQMNSCGEAAHQPAERGERAEECGAGGDDRLAALEVADHAERERRDREDQDVRRTEPAELGVVERQFALDRLEQREDDVAVEIVEQVDERQQRRAPSRRACGAARAVATAAQKPTVAMPRRLRLSSRVRTTVCGLSVTVISFSSPATIFPSSQHACR